jgi:CheY-like chemotaxis protein
MESSLFGWRQGHVLLLFWWSQAGAAAQNSFSQRCCPPRASGVRKVNRVACGDDVTSLVPPSARAFGSGCRENRAARNENDIRHLTPIGGEFKCMRPAAPKRPVVLIVEDEFLLRMDAVGMITDAGFEVVEAANADDAIEILEARRDISVVFTDIQMPGSMDGLKLARAVRGRWPPIKIVATSGLVDVGEKDLPEGGRFLQKPYEAEALAGVLLELTGRI